MARRGVDLSEMNGSVDFPALKAAGVEFVIIRCGYGGDFVHQDDARFRENVEKADDAGMPWGAYLYSYAKDVSMARDEAQHTLRLLNGRKPAYGVWYDVEDTQQAGCDLVSICEAYCTAIESAGCYCGIYSMLSWLNGKLNSSRLDKYDKWVADWDTSCGYQKPYGMWQYTDRLMIGGRAFDGNLAYLDYPALTAGRPDSPHTEKEDGEMTYEQFRAFAQRYEEERGKAAESGWSRQEGYWKKATELGVTDGSRPRGFCAREELAAMLGRLGLLRG